MGKLSNHLAKPAASRVVRTSISLDKDVYAKGQDRARKLPYKNFSKYLEALVEIDVRERPRHVLIKEESPRLRARDTADGNQPAAAKSLRQTDAQ